MSVFKRGEVWWYKFTWHGEPVRESTKQTNKRVAQQMEAARKTALAKGEVGIRERKAAPTLREFAESRFVPFVTERSADKPRTLRYYQNGLRALLAFKQLAETRLDEIQQNQITEFVARCRAEQLEVSSINRRLEVLRRMFKLAMEWGTVEKPLPKVAMLPGAKRRERVLSVEEETAYVRATMELGQNILAAHGKALTGIRARLRGIEPVKPRDPFLLRDVAVVLLDCGLRPEECFRLRWDEVRDGALRITHGKTANARRVVPMPDRAMGIIEMRRGAALSSEWVFPAETRSGHVEASTLKKPHRKACALAGVDYFPLYTMRHTFITRLAAHVDPYTLAHVAGHADFATTRRYVHPQAATVREAMERARKAWGGHNSGHSDQTGATAPSAEQLTNN